MELTSLQESVNELSQRYRGVPLLPDHPGYQVGSSHVALLANISLQAARKRVSKEGDQGRYANAPLVGFLLESARPITVPMVRVPDISEARVRGLTQPVLHRDVAPNTPFILNAIEFVYFMILPEYAGVICNGQDRSKPVRMGLSSSFMRRGEHAYPGISAIIKPGDPVPPTVVADVAVSPEQYRLKEQFHRELSYLRYARLYN